MYNRISKYDYAQISYMKESDHDSIKILTGEYAGTVVTYGKICLTEPTLEDPDAEIIFSYEYVVNESNLDTKTLESDEFKTYLGDMLQVIILEALEHNNFAIGVKPVDTNSHFEKSYN
jgi:hypothetical protein